MSREIPLRTLLHSQTQNCDFCGDVCGWHGVGGSGYGSQNGGGSDGGGDGGCVVGAGDVGGVDLFFEEPNLLKGNHKQIKSVQYFS